MHINTLTSYSYSAKNENAVGIISRLINGCFSYVAMFCNIIIASFNSLISSEKWITVQETTIKQFLL